VNEQQKRACGKKSRSLRTDLKKTCGSHWWGLAFKPNTDGLCARRADLDIVRGLLAHGAEVSAYDSRGNSRKRKGLR